MCKCFKNSREAFTLIELLAVIVILGILMSIAVIGYSYSQRKAKDDALKLTITTIESSLNDHLNNCAMGYYDENDTICSKYKIPEVKKGTTKVWLVDLINDSLIEPVSNPYNTSEKCNANSSYVLVTNTSKDDMNVSYDYLVCLDCGESYKTNNAKCDFTFSAPTSDKEQPQINEVTITSKEKNYNSNDVIVKINAKDNESGIKDMCISQTEFGECKWESYKEEKEITFSGNLDGNTRYIYLTIRDLAGNYIDYSKDYTPYKECTNLVDFAKEDWSTCTKSCGTGTQTREVEQKDKETGKTCNVKVETQNCNTQNCCSETEVKVNSDWGTCSKACGGGVQTRVVQEYSKFDSTIACGEAYEESTECNKVECCSSTKPSNGAWGTCNGTCGTGSQTRTVKYYSTYDNSYCSEKTETQSCNLTPCVIGVANKTYTVGEIVTYAGIKWRVMKNYSDSVLLIYDKSEVTVAMGHGDGWKYYWGKSLIKTYLENLVNNNATLNIDKQSGGLMPTTINDGTYQGIYTNYTLPAGYNGNVTGLIRVPTWSEIANLPSTFKSVSKDYWSLSVMDLNLEPEGKWNLKPYDYWNGYYVWHCKSNATKGGGYTGDYDPYLTRYVRAVIKVKKKV